MWVRRSLAAFAGGVAMVTAGFASIASAAETRALETRFQQAVRSCSGKNSCRVDFPSLGKGGKILAASCNIRFVGAPGSVSPTAVVLGLYNPATKKFVEAAYPAPPSQLAYYPEQVYQVFSSTLVLIKANEQAAIRVDLNSATDMKLSCGVSGEFTP